MIQSAKKPHTGRFVRISVFTVITLLAIAVPGQAKDITLAWDTSPDENVDHYVVYWGVELGNYTQNSPPIKDAASYTVKGLEEGKIYYFSAKAVGATGLESDFSNEAAIPQIDSPKDACTINGETGTGVSIQGRAAGSAAVEILLNASPLATTTASEDGKWSVTVDFSSVPESAFELKAVSTGADSSPVSGQYDKTAPISSITGFPQYGTDEIPVNWTASDAFTGVASTELWYKKESGGDWTKSALSSDDVEGAFLFEPPLGDGVYYFATRAVDNAGNAEASPSENGGGEVICDNQPPTSQAIVRSESRSTSVTVEWSASDDFSGVASTRLFYKQENDGEWTDTGLSPRTGTSGAFSYSPPQTNTTYAFQTRSVDKAGNEEPLEAADSGNEIVLDSTQPTSTITEAPTMVQGLLRAEFSIRWTASDDTSSIDSTELWVRKGADGLWKDSGLPPQDGDSGVFAYQPALGDGTYYFATRTTDAAGNVEELPAGKGGTSTLIQADLSDAVMALQILSGIDVGEVNRAADVNGDGRIGISEVIYFLRSTTAQRYLL